ncbi:hypothetical protein [Haladaptatus halobius]|uniref:hypothetical protein n=1 Tax=Haladaptatus halobius TaxID=2884875 RepID=UPI001D0AF6D5|nr:hypothetical protein [Haladaptatus halobius]
MERRPAEGADGGELAARSDVVSADRTPRRYRIRHERAGKKRADASVQLVAIMSIRITPYLSPA